MTSQAGKFIPDAPDSGEIGQFLQRFVDTGSPIEQAIVDDLVRVRVGPGMNVQSVEILDASLDVALKTRLETAIVGAVNIAMRRAIVAAGQALRDYARQRQSSAPDDGTDSQEFGG
jgi:type II secretory pathway predicted ATPase ExeA